MSDGQFVQTLVSQYTERIQDYHITYEIFRSRESLELNDEIGKQVALADFNKHYPVTVMENQWLLMQYIEFLKSYNIIPILVVMPVIAYYRKYYPNNVIKTFYECLPELQGLEDVQILDYFGSGDYPDHFWYHVNYVNYIGARYFTEKMHRDIEW